MHALHRNDYRTALFALSTQKSKMFLQVSRRERSTDEDRSGDLSARA
jgi:hypothetical protein